MAITSKSELKQFVEKAVAEVEITDVHTHIFPEAFGELLLWGIDELLTYHYLIAEYFRYSSMDYEEFFALSKSEQADLIWQKLFIDHSPISESVRGVLTVLKKLDIDVSSRDLNEIRKYFDSLSTSEYIDIVFEVAKVKDVVMTNDPFDPKEQTLWQNIGNNDSRFKAALRLDSLLNDYDNSYQKLNELGYSVSKDIDVNSVELIKSFLRDWAKKINPLYMAVSLPPAFTLPEASSRYKLIDQCVLPVCRELDIPMAMMIGVNKLVNYKLNLAGDAVGKANIRVVEHLCRNYPENKFMVTMLARENQHELAVQARKFRNLMVFGCWWFLNNPSLIEEITRMRTELLGLSYIPQHSDARVLDQLIYKWSHSRTIIAKVLVDKYSDLLDTNWTVTEEEITRDVAGLFGETFWQYLKK